MASSSSGQPASLITVRIVYAALMLSILMYGVLAFAVTGAATDPLEGADAAEAAAAVEQTVPPAALTYILAGVGVICLIAAIAVRRTAAPWRKRPELFEQDTDTVAKTKAIASPAGHYFTRSIIAWALCEATAIFGLVLALVHQNGDYYLPFASAAIIAMLLVAPKAADLTSIPKRS